MIKTLSIGHATIDIVIKMEENFQGNLNFGKKQKVDYGAICAGGGAVNSAICFSKLGANSHIVCHIGCDSSKAIILDTLKMHDIKSNYIAQEDCSSGFSVIIATDNKPDQAVITSSATQENLNFDEFDDIQLTYTTRLDLIENIKKTDFIGLNPSFTTIKHAAQTASHIFKKITYFALNLSESKYLFTLLSGDKTFNLKEYVKLIHNLGVKYIAITDGGDGAYFSTEDEILFARPLKEPVIGTVGAGDSFSATASFFLYSTGDPYISLKSAVANSSNVTKFLDANSGNMNKEKIKDKIKQIKVEKLSI